MWFTDSETNKIGKITTSGVITTYSLPSGSRPAGITAGPDGNLWFTDIGSSKVGKINTSGVVTEYALPSGSEPNGITAGPDGNLWFPEVNTSKIGKITTSGTITEYSLPSGGDPYGITAGPDGNLWYTNYTLRKIGKITTSGTITEYSLPSYSNPYGITAGPDGNLWFTDSGTDKIGKITTSGTVTEYLLPEGSEPYGITSSPDGNLWFTDLGTGEVGKITTSGTITEYSVGMEDSSIGIAAGPDGDLWFTHLSGGGIGKMPTSGNGATKGGETYSPQPGTTIEYRVPVSGAGARYNMSEGEVAKWGQTDDPREAMAIFPPAKPMGWPATEYERATIDYMDEEGHTVNVASPSGGISTTEYNEINEAKRTLSADNRVTALAAKEKSVEVADELENKNIYNEKYQLAETLGPEHEVKVAKGNEKGIKAGSEVMAREHVKYFYDEGSPEGKIYNLVTKTEDAAETASKEEFDPRTTKTSYSGAGSCEGHEVSGWTLRKPTSVTKEPGGVNLTTTTVYEPCTGNVVETRSPAGSTQAPPAYAFTFGSGGSGSGQFSHPMQDAVDSSGNVWVADGYNDRVEKFSGTGAFLASYGEGGSSETKLQFNEPDGLAINQTTGNVYVADSHNNRVVEMSSSGGLVRVFGKAGSGEGQFKESAGIAIDSKGNVWVTDYGNDRVEEFSETGVYLKKEFGGKGQGNGQFEGASGIAIAGGDVYVTDEVPARVEVFNEEGKFVRTWGSSGEGAGQFKYPSGVSVGPNGNVYVADGGNARVQEFGPTGQFLTSFGTKGSGNGQMSEPEGVATTSSGAIYVTDAGTNNRVQVWESVPSAPVYTSQFGTKGTENGQVKEPRGVAMTKSGNVDVLDSSNSRVEEFGPSGTYLNKFGASGSEKGQMSVPLGITVDAKGNVWVADSANNRVDEFNEKREWVQAFGWGVNKGESKLEVCTTTCKAGAAGSGPGQFKEPKGIAVNASGDVYVADSANNRVEEFTEKGAFLAAFGFKVNESGKEEFEICTSKCKAGTAGSGNGQFKEPGGLAIAPNGTVWVADTGNQRVEEFGEKNEYLTKFGSAGTGNGQFKEPKGIAIDSAGNVWVTDGVNDRVQELTPSGTFLTAFGDKGTGNGQFEEPWGIAFGASGAVYVADVKNNRVQKFTLAPSPGNEGVHDARISYYSSEEESEIPACRKHPEWANLPCQTEPAAQTGLSGSPALPITTLTYNIWDEVEKTEEKFTWINSEGKEEKVTRTKAQTYDPAGRAVTSEEKAEPATDTALPKVTNKYNEETGALETQSAEIGGKTKTITSVDNTLGELEKYTDAEGNTSTYVYNLEGQVEEVNDGQSEKKGVQTYAYAPSTGYLEKLVDSSAGTFTATYDSEGKMLTENYPNGMTAKYTYNQLGTATGIEYKKEKDCATKCPETWFSDTNTPSIHGETLQQSSTLSKENYTYDEEGRLAETQETPTGKGCKSRLYAYNEESDRTSQTTRESSTETCATEGGLLQAHSYDAANHLIDAGVKYETFGNILTLPEADAEGHALTSTYYVDNQVLSQTQNGTTNEYVYDPVGRTMETKSEVKSTKVKTAVIPHYSGPGEALTWTSEEEGKKWSRDIPGIDGALDAIEKSGEETKPVLQIHDLQGDIVGEASDSETETKLLKTYNSTEFGVPNEGKAPPKYAWLGAGGVASETSFGTGTVTQGGASYVPQIARNLQTAPVVPPGAFPDGQGTGSENTAEIPGWYISLSNAESAATVAEWTAKQEAKKAGLQLVGMGSDPTQTRYFGNTGEYTMQDVLGYVQGCFAEGVDRGIEGDTPVAECLVRITHYFLANQYYFETYAFAGTAQFFVEWYSSEMIIAWGLFLEEALEGCIASQVYMCGIEVHSSVFEMTNEGMLEISKTIQYVAMPVVKDCYAYKSECYVTGEGDF